VIRLEMVSILLTLNKVSNRLANYSSMADLRKITAKNIVGFHSYMAALIGRRILTRYKSNAML